MGIKMALGARRTELVGKTVLGMVYIGVGGASVGLIGALWSSRLLSGFLFGVEPWDAATYGVAAALIVLVCLAASYAPARRIATVDPVEVLNVE